MIIEDFNDLHNKPKINDNLPHDPPPARASQGRPHSPSEYLLPCPGEDDPAGQGEDSNECPEIGGAVDLNY